MAQPEVSCHPETLLEGARTVVSAALCYWRRGPEPPPGEGRLPRYTWWRPYADAAREARRARRAARRRVPRARGREPARRPRGRRALRRRLLRQEHDADHAAPRLVGRARDARHRRRSSRRRRRSTPTAAPARSASTPARPARSTSPACSTRRAASRTGRSRAEPDAGGDTARRSATAVYGCDICQDVCPWNRGVEKRRAGGAARGAEPHVSLADWLAGRRRRAASPRYDRLYVPRNDPRYLRRNALVALGNAGGEHAPLRRAYAEGDDPLLREHAEWALERLAVNGELRRLRDVERWIALGARSAPSRSRSSRSRSAEHYPPALRALGVDRRPRIFAVGALAIFALSRREWSKAALKRIGLAALTFDFAIVSAYTLDLQLRAGLARSGR